MNWIRRAGARFRPTDRRIGSGLEPVLWERKHHVIEHETVDLETRHRLFEAVRIRAFDGAFLLHSFANVANEQNAGAQREGSRDFNDQWLRTVRSAVVVKCHACRSHVSRHFVLWVDWTILCSFAASVKGTNDNLRGLVDQSRPGDQGDVLGGF